MKNKKIVRFRGRILTAVGLYLAVNGLVTTFLTFFIINFGNGQLVYGFDIIFGKIFDNILSAKVNDNGVSAILYFTGLKFSLPNFLPVLFIIVGVVFTGVMSLIDTRKCGIAWRIVTGSLFFISAVLITFRAYFIYPVISTEPEDVLLDFYFTSSISFSSILCGIILLLASAFTFIGLAVDRKNRIFVDINLRT